jgi:hypothetical protein
MRLCGVRSDRTSQRFDKAVLRELGSRRAGNRQKLDQDNGNRWFRGEVVEV